MKTDLMQNRPIKAGETVLLLVMLGYGALVVFWVCVGVAMLTGHLHWSDPVCG